MRRLPARAHPQPTPRQPRKIGTAQRPILVRPALRNRAQGPPLLRAQPATAASAALAAPPPPAGAERDSRFASWASAPTRGTSAAHPPPPGGERHGQCIESASCIVQHTKTARSVMNRAPMGPCAPVGSRASPARALAIASSLHRWRPRTPDSPAPPAMTATAVHPCGAPDPTVSPEHPVRSARPALAPAARTEAFTTAFRLRAAFSPGTGGGAGDYFGRFQRYGMQGVQQ